MGFRDHMLQHLHTNLIAESKAYGYTLVIWGSGAVLIQSFGLPNVNEVMLYVLGALTGFGILALMVYGAVFRSIRNVDAEEMIVSSMVHLLAALGTIAIAVVIAQYFGSYWAFFLSGVNASISYNLLMLPEVLFSERLAKVHH